MSFYVEAEQEWGINSFEAEQCGEGSRLEYEEGETAVSSALFLCQGLGSLYDI